MELKLNIDCLPNQIQVNPLEIIKTGFVFNTGYKDIFLSPNDLIWKMGNHEVYSMSFYNPITYIGFIYLEIEPRQTPEQRIRFKKIQLFSIQ